MNIYEKMSAITEEITAVAKNLNVGWGKNQYKAVSEADVLAAVKPIEIKHGVYSYPFSREIIDTSVLTSTKPDGSDARQLFMRVETVYRFVNTEKPDEYIDITTYGDGVDPQDKAPGKAMTYGDKYALLKAYKIITGDDPDQNYSQDLKEKETKAKKPAAKKAEKTKEELKTDQRVAEAAAHDPTALIKPVEAKALERRCAEAKVDLSMLLGMYKEKKTEELNYKQYDNILRNWDKVLARLGGTANE